VRKFDAEGRIVAEEQFADAPHDFVLPEEIRSKLNPGQIKAVGAFAASVENRANSYSYDAQGRVTEAAQEWWTFWRRSDDHKV